MCKEKSGISFGIGLLAGVVGGIVAGILYAPDKGSNTRQKVKNTVVEFAEKHSPAISEAKKQAMESVDILKYQLEKQYRKFDNMLKNKKLRKAKELEESNGYDFN